jgi:hypothetical protein
MPIEMGRRLGVDLVEETNEFLVSMTRHAAADHFAIEHAQPTNRVVVPLRL